MLRRPVALFLCGLAGLTGFAHLHATAAGDHVPPVTTAVSAGELASPSAGYTAWAALEFTPEELADPAVSAPLADPDGDGLSNFLEYALGGAPREASSAPAPLLVRPGAANPATPLALSFHRVADPALVYRVQTSDDLSSPLFWGDLWTSTGTENTAGPVTIADEVPFASRPRRFLRLQVDLVQTPDPIANETRAPHLWPYTAGSLWNTPVGGAIRRGSTHHSLATMLNSQVGQLNWATYSTPVNSAGASGVPLTIHEVAAGTWSPAIRSITVARAPASVLISGDMTGSTITYNAGGSISFTKKPDGFMALVDTTTMTATEAYKTCWSSGGAADRILIAREGSVRSFDLRGDGWTQRGSRASGLTFMGGLIRQHDLDKVATDRRNAIRHALALAINNSQLLNPDQDAAYPTPGLQWPARSFDSDGRSNYAGAIRMGTHFVLHPGFDIEASTLTPEGKALAYALRDYGAYIVDRSSYVSLYAEQQINSGAADRLKKDWQNLLLKAMVPVLNNSASAVGGPGPRVRPPAPDFAP